MPPGPTLDRVGRLGARKHRGRLRSSMQNPGAFGAESDPTQVKGGIARTTGSPEYRAAKQRSCRSATEEVKSVQMKMRNLK